MYLFVSNLHYHRLFMPSHHSLKWAKSSKRMNDLLSQMKPVTHENRDGHMVFPAEDPRVIKVCKKIIRGLSYYHKIDSPISEERVSVGVLKFEIPEHILNEMEYHHRDPDIVQYRYSILNYENIRSVWVITFFQISDIPWMGIDKIMNNLFFSNIGDIFTCLK